MRAIDVRHKGRERVICCWEADGVLVDPGPESTLETLLEGLGDTRPEALLLTHIHFDHAGASGALVRRWPELPVYVHERGAPHMAAPEKLVASAKRLYGEEGFGDLWGEVVPVPEGNLRVLEGGETLLDGRFEVAYTPGHASHHVAYRHPATGRAFVGDVAGVRVEPAGLVLAPTPPPDVDVEAWERSLDLLEAWEPSALCLTHFGLVEEPAEHLTRMRAALRREAELAAELDHDAFVERVERWVREEAGEPAAGSYLQAAPAEHLFQGLARWHRKRGTLTA